jgi:hypothetical protein
VTKDEMREKAENHTDAILLHCKISSVIGGERSPTFDAISLGIERLMLSAHDAGWNACADAAEAALVNPGGFPPKFVGDRIRALKKGEPR